MYPQRGVTGQTTQASRLPGRPDLDDNLHEIGSANTAVKLRNRKTLGS